MEAGDANEGGEEMVKWVTGSILIVEQDQRHHDYFVDRLTSTLPERVLAAPTVPILSAHCCLGTGKDLSNRGGR